MLPAVLTSSGSKTRAHNWRRSQYLLPHNSRRSAVEPLPGPPHPLPTQPSCLRPALAELERQDLTRQFIGRHVLLAFILNTYMQLRVACRSRRRRRLAEDSLGRGRRRRVDSLGDRSLPASPVYLRDTFAFRGTAGGIGICTVT